jgi:hypothetical protein
MCTLAWGSGDGRLWAVFNRDEQRARPPAQAPRIEQGANGPVACARDPQGGGTWFAASARGFAVALLNHYPAQSQLPPAPRSRGLLVSELAAGSSAAQAFDRFAAVSLACYAPFHLFLLTPQGASGFTWDGAALQPLQPASGFWTTSSFAPQAVVAWRRARWREAFAGRAPAAAAVLQQPSPDRPAYGFAMDREDARTVSQIVLELDPAGFTFTCREREADGAGFGAPVVLRHPAGR